MENNDKTIVIASGNAGKIREFREMLEPEGYRVLSLKDLPDYAEPAETGSTFRENAIIKAQSVTDRYQVEALGDDSGLSIDVFGGRPGVYSARWLGHDTPYREKNRVVLEKMQGVKERGCHYTCAIAWTRPGRKPVVFEDIVEGEIALAPAGDNGFGYDPIVYYPPCGKTMAEMSEEEKNAISHRGKALRKLEAWLHDKKD
jgi:XTP/dITP diphosphohydrolase